MPRGTTRIYATPPENAHGTLTQYQRVSPPRRLAWPSGPPLLFSFAETSPPRGGDVPSPAWPGHTSSVPPSFWVLSRPAHWQSFDGPLHLFFRVVSFPV